MIVPVLSYRDAHAAAAFLKTAFGFEERMLHPDDNGGIVHAEYVLDGGMVMFGSEKSGRLHWPPGSACVYVVLDDVDDHYERAKAAGAEIVMEPTDQDYGSRDYVARDPEGNLWSFGTYRPEV
jgi:uncharacterized glyoxalase superfamily protein PhnB